MATMNDFIAALNGLSKAAEARITQPINATAESVAGYYQTIESKITGPVESAASATGSYYDSIAADLANGVITSTETAIGGAKSLTDWRKYAPQEVLDAVDAELDRVNRSVWDTIVDTVGGVIGGVGEVVDDIVNGIGTAVDDVGNAVADIVIKIPDVFEQVFTGMTAAVEPLTDNLKVGLSALTGGIDGIGNGIALMTKIGKLANFMHSPDKEIAALDRVAQRGAHSWGDEASRAAVTDGAAVGCLVGAPLGFLPIVNDCYTAGMGEAVRNIARSIYHPTHLAINELATAYIRGLIDEDKLLFDGQQLGFSKADVVNYVKLSRQMLNANDLITLWLRGELSDNEVDIRLSEIGIVDEDIPKLKALSRYIPGVPDLIHMAVREAFTPEIAERFGQYEGLPQPFVEWAGKQGLSQEWALRYWAAHWELPSADMGFAMFQRGIISEDDLRLLLRALDVMPFWRDKLIKLSYNPITRVDIRRMHKMKLITDEGLIPRYKAIGYSPEDAAALAQFTIELNKEEAKLEKQPERDLTASEILSAYSNVLIGRGDAAGLLKSLGYDDNEIEYKLALAELPAIKRKRSKQIDIIRQRLIYGAIDLNGAVDALNKLNLPQAEYEYQLLDIQQDLELARIKEIQAHAKATLNKPTAEQVAAEVREHFDA